MDALMQRMATEIRDGNYTVIQHKLCWERKFCEMLIESCVCNTLFPFGKAWNCVGINQRDSTGRTLLHAAVGCHNYTAAKILLERGANVNISPKQDTKSFLAGIAQSILEKDPHRIVRIMAYGETVLHYACKNRDVDAIIIRLLTDHGAHINRVDENGETALHYLCQREEEDDGISHGGWRGLYKAFSKAVARTMGSGQRYRASNRDSMVFQADNWQTLLDHLCQKYGIDEKELDITRSSCGNRQLEAETEEAKVITMLIQNGADVNKTDKYGQTAFHLLCQRSRVDVRTVHLLLQNGASVNAADNNGNTPLHYICQRHKADISTLYLLTERSVDYTLKNKYGNTAIYFLCQSQNVRLGNFPR
ncbi:putative ankyrin repeat protein RF_0381 [Haliotis rufescens]|uniref:putative ankyrin repeat protein RF_0381 n=1 Tax=Haliotis rufescens TaxID=6454 RepID=UPI00201E8C56|nr:putative ankyrin repeat protein RF_0381 [Haliotis rufescens]